MHFGKIRGVSGHATRAVLEHSRSRSSASSQPAADGSTGVQPVLAIGWVVVALAAPVLLIGCVATGVRMGLRDREDDGR